MVDDKMNKKEEKTNNKRIFSTSEAVILVIISLLVGFAIGCLNSKKGIVINNKVIGDNYLQEFINNYNFILNNYYEKVDKESLINSAIAGMMKSLDDPYSVYIDKEESDNFSITLNGSYDGFGIQIVKDPTTGYMLITYVFEDSPASKQGIVVGDLIVSLNDKESKDLTATEFCSLVKNGKNKTFKLKILRDEKEEEISITRDNVTITSVSSEVYEVDNKKIGYIYIGIFANNTLSQFKSELDKLESQNIEYLIIDVRSNTGGHLVSVDGILDIFLNKKQIMYQFEKSNQRTPMYGTGEANKNYEIVLLGNESSASASEVLIAGLKENLNSIFIGKKTYGKGTVQELVTLSDGTQYKITINKWLTPKGNWINDTEGIIPDIEVELDDKYFETYESNDDTQLQAAINYIKNKAQ